MDYKCSQIIQSYALYRPKKYLSNVVTAIWWHRPTYMLSPLTDFSSPQCGFGRSFIRLVKPEQLDKKKGYSTVGIGDASRLEKSPIPDQFPTYHREYLALEIEERSFKLTHKPLSEYHATKPSNDHVTLPSPEIPCSYEHQRLQIDPV